MPHSKKRTQAQTGIGSDWSWPKLIEVLTREDAPERRHVNRTLWRLQRDGFRELRRAIEDTDDPTSWENPFLVQNMPFPFEWNTEIALSSITSPLHRRQRDLLAVLETLTAGVAVQLEGDTILRTHVLSM